MVIGRKYFGLNSCIIRNNECEEIEIEIFYICIYVIIMCFINIYSV